MALAGVNSTAYSAPIADPKKGFVTSIHSSQLIFHAALSGKFGPIEAEVRYDDPEGATARIAGLRFARVDDFERCAQARRGRRYGFIGPEGGLLIESGTDELLVRGTCVIATPIAALSAPYDLSYTNNDDQTYELYDRATKKLIKAVDADDVMSLFGVEGIVLEPDSLLFRTDPVTDGQLVRALTSTESARDAAVDVLSQRVFIVRDLSPIGVYARVKQPTSPAVADALIASGALTDPREDVRARGLRAAAALPNAKDKLTPVVIAGLTTPVIPENAASNIAYARELAKEPPDSREAQRFRRELERDGWGVSKWPDVVPPQQPAHRNIHIRSAAGLAASLFSQAAAEKALNAMWSEVAEITGPDWIIDEGIYLVVGAAGQRGEVLTRVLIDKALRDDQGEGYRAIRMMLAIPKPSSALRNAIKPICDRREGHAWGTVHCDVLGVRGGNKALLKRLQSQVAFEWEHRSSPGTVHRFIAADALLVDLAPEGHTYLRKAALSKNRIDAIAALSALCILGPAAGPGMLQRAEALLATDPKNKQLNQIAADCRRKEMTVWGWFTGARE